MVQEAYSNQLSNMGFNKEHLAGQAAELNLHGTQTQSTIDHVTQMTKDMTSDKHHDLSNHLSDRSEKGTIRRFYDGPRNNVGMFQPYAKDQAPLGWQKPPKGSEVAQ